MLPKRLLSCAFSTILDVNGEMYGFSGVLSDENIHSGSLPVWRHGHGWVSLSVMRYVIAVCVVAGFLIWDVLSNEGRYLDEALRVLRHVLRYFGA